MKLRKMNIHRVIVAAIALAAVMIIGADADRKHCFCDLRWSTTRLEAGDSANGLPIVTNLGDPSYHHWLSVGCRRVLRECPGDCRAVVHQYMGGSAFTVASGQAACESVRRNAPPGRPVYVYATYDPSVCANRRWQYVDRLCCWEISFTGYNSIFLHNHQCADECPPTGC
ncbi:uncharacterized protein LOC110982826 [Acanthaster planci]|uniref:Uncharacterized protein LOC110982826 n=1 Tax=Acanthaster planci TaxID=133434 RepID=A0A8B7Z1D5_ACAPL|nr:uncharacterized protein LOC110982826 [Acanthaster planci]